MEFHPNAEARLGVGLSVKDQQWGSTMSGIKSGPVRHVRQPTAGKRPEREAHPRPPSSWENKIVQNSLETARVATIQDIYSG